MNDYRVAGNHGEQFIEPHALTAAAGYDDGAEHEVKKLEAMPSS
jgi:hypothetical protein